MLDKQWKWAYDKTRTKHENNTKPGTHAQNNGARNLRIIKLWLISTKPVVSHNIQFQDKKQNMKHDQGKLLNYNILVLMKKMDGQTDHDTSDKVHNMQC